jgi:lauroyl/myristoyl acyltransferase
VSRETPKETTAYYVYRGVERLSIALPHGVGRAVFGALGAVAHDVLPGVRATVAANQAQVLGLPVDSALVRSATREAFRLYAHYWFDTFHLRGMPSAEFDRRMRLEGLEHIDAGLEAGHGVICVLPHLGNWDAGGRGVAANGYPLVAVAEELKPPRLFELFLEHRTQLGMEILPLRGGAHVGQQLAARLAGNKVVALVADRDLSGRGVEVEMFGRARRVPAGPALLSITSGAPLLPCPTYTTPEGWIVRIGPPVEAERTGSTKADVVALTKAMAAAFERAIAARSTDWHMFQPAWPEPAP